MAQPTPTPTDFAQALIEEMKKSGHAFWIDPETHAEQHAFIATMIAEREERIARRKRLEEKIAGSLALSVILLVIGLLGSGIMTYLRSHGIGTG